MQRGVCPSVCNEYRLVYSPAFRCVCCSLCNDITRFFLSFLGIQVPATSLREDLTSRNFDPVPAVISQQPVGGRIYLNIADHPTPRTFEERWRETRLGRDAVRNFVSTAEPLVFASGPQKQVRQEVSLTGTERRLVDHGSQ